MIVGDHGASTSSRPRPTSTPAAAAVTDFATDCERCRVRGVHAVEIALIDDGAVLQHDEAVGIGLVQQAGERRGRALRREVTGRSSRSAPCAAAGARAVTAPDLGRGQDLADVLEAPAVPRRPVPVHARRNELRRRALHDRRAGIGIAVGGHRHAPSKSKRGRPFEPPPVTPKGFTSSGSSRSCCRSRRLPAGTAARIRPSAHRAAG